MKEEQKLEIVKKNIYAGSRRNNMDNGNEIPKVNPEEEAAKKLEQELERRKAEKLALRAKKKEEREKRKKAKKERDEKSKESKEEDKKLSEERLREEWYKAFTEEELANQDTRSTIEIAIKHGYRPSDVTSVGQVEATAKDVIFNSLLGDDARKVKAGEKLGRKLTDEQEELIIKIHNIGKGEIGKNGSPASVYNYTVGQLLRKRRLLKVLEKTGVTEEEVRSLVEAGIVGETIPSDPTLSGPLKTQLEILNQSLSALPDNDVISRSDAMTETLNRVSSMPGVNEAQKDILLKKIAAAQAPLKQQETELRHQAEGRQREEVAHEFVKTSDLSIEPSNFNSDEETSRIAKEAKEAIEKQHAGNGFLKENVERLYKIQQKLEASEGRAHGPEAARISRALAETSKLRGMLQGAKNLINGRELENELKTGKYQGLYGEIRLTPEKKEELIEKILDGREGEVDEEFNKLFHDADTRTGDDWQEAQSQASQLEVNDFARGLSQFASDRMTFKGQFLTAVKKNKLDQVGRRLSAEIKLRKNLHDVAFYVNKNFGVEDILKVVKTFSVEDADMAYNVKGVPEVSHFFEQAMYEVMLRHGGHLPSEAMMNGINGDPGEVEALVRAQIREAIKIGAIDWDLEKDHWQIDRAVSVARGMGIVTGRTIEIVAGAGIPPETGGGVLVGWWANNIIKKIAFFRQISRYDVGKEANRFMAYKLENTSRFWHTKELSGISGLSDPKLLNNWFNESDDDRWSDMLNPGQVGSIFYQTGWRYGEDKVNHAGAIVRLLADNPFNPIIGAGMWVEKQRRQLNNTDEISASERLELRNQFGIDLGPNGTKGDKAALIISKNLDLAAQITPLKLFHNLVGLKQQVLRTYYLGSISEPAGEEGRITITDEVLKGDLETLAVIQEKLVKKRTDSYKNYLKEKEANPGSGLRPPDLYNVDADINIEIDQLIAGNKLDAGKGGRIKAFVKHVNDEFTASTGGNLSQKDKLISNLKDKGWKIPFIFGTDDLPYDLFNFAATGSNGFERRWGDINSVAQAASLFEKLIRDIPNIPDQDTLIGKMNEIYDAMAGHDEGRTREFMVRFAEGIVKFYKKDIVKRIPAGFGMFDGMVNGEASFAQIAYGRKQMAWNELDVRRFVNEVQFHGLVEKGALDELRKKTGAEGWIMGLAIARSGIPLGLLGFFYYMFTAEMEGLVKAA